MKRLSSFTKTVFSYFIVDASTSDATTSLKPIAIFNL